MTYAGTRVHSQVRRWGIASTARVLLVAAITWGVLSFGAVYPWGYWPLAALAAAAGALGFVAAARSSRRQDLMALTLTLALFIAAALAQLIPLPLAMLQRMSPATLDMLRQFNPAVAAGLLGRHPLSVQPDLTITAVVLIACWALVTLGCARLFSVTGTAWFIRALAIVGAVVALIGIVQAPLFNGKIYGFWQPIFQGSPFGPFVNRNHFAGWMLMSISATLGLFFASISRGMRGVKPTLRDRLVWFATPEANRALLIGGAIMIMSLALFMATSRSGILALLATGAVVSVLAMRHQHTIARKALTITYPLLVAILVIGWVGLDRLQFRFSHDVDGVEARLGAWSDAWRITRAFPLAGTGLDTYGTATLFYQRHNPLMHYAQAHNDYLQLAAEGGVLLVVPAVACMIAFAATVRRRFLEGSSAGAYWVRLGVVGGLFAVGLQELVDFSLQMPGNAMLFATLCGIALHRAPSEEDRLRARTAGRPRT